MYISFSKPAEEFRQYMQVYRLNSTPHNEHELKQ